MGEGMAVTAGVGGTTHTVSRYRYVGLGLEVGVYPTAANVVWPVDAKQRPLLLSSHFGITYGASRMATSTYQTQGHKAD